jgi:hypothetical protein
MKFSECFASNTMKKTFVRTKNKPSCLSPIKIETNHTPRETKRAASCACLIDGQLCSLFSACGTPRPQRARTAFKAKSVIVSFINKLSTTVRAPFCGADDRESKTLKRSLTFDFWQLTWRRLMSPARVETTWLRGHEEPIRIYNGSPYGWEGRAFTR